MRMRWTRLSSALLWSGSLLRPLSRTREAGEERRSERPSERAHRHGGVDPLHVGLFDEDLSRLEAELLDLCLGDVLAPSELFNLSGDVDDDD